MLQLNFYSEQGGSGKTYPHRCLYFLTIVLLFLRQWPWWPWCLKKYNCRVSLSYAVQSFFSFFFRHTQEGRDGEEIKYIKTMSDSHTGNYISELFVTRWTIGISTKAEWCLCSKTLDTKWLEMIKTKCLVLATLREPQNKGHVFEAEDTHKK